MTNLAWLIYGAEVIGNFALSFGIILFLAAISTVIGFVGMAATASVDGTDSEEFAKAKMFAQKSALATALIIVVGTFIPSRNAIMLMAAANYGDELYKSDLKEIVDPAKDLLKKWINDQLQEKKK